MLKKVTIVGKKKKVDVNFTHAKKKHLVWFLARHQNGKTKTELAI